MRFVVAGSSGLIGAALRRSLEEDGHSVLRLVRQTPREPSEVRWNPPFPVSPNPLEGADVIVNLAGAALDGQRWTRRYKKELLRSRTETAAAIATLAAGARRPPRLLISASGMRWYGVDRGAELLNESSAPSSSGFLPMVAQAWERATEPATAAGILVCHLRMGLVLSLRGGFLPPLLAPFRVGLGACVGPPEAFWSFVSLTDAVRAIRFLAVETGTQGPYNITAPQPVRSREFTQAVARMIGKPAWLRVPSWTVAVTRGRSATEVLGSLRVLPSRLGEAGFAFLHPDIDAALRDALVRS
jgi:uncharacterized protein